MGLTVAKRFVKRANQRNRIKRVIRDSFRLNQHDIPHLDIVVFVRNGVMEMENAEIKN